MEGSGAKRATSGVWAVCCVQWWCNRAWAWVGGGRMHSTERCWDTADTCAHGPAVADGFRDEMNLSRLATGEADSDSTSFLLGGAVAMLSVGSCLGAPVAGQLADLVGRRLATLAGALLATIGGAVQAASSGDARAALLSAR